MSWENWTGTWQASRGSDDERWNHNQWRDAKDWQSWSAADNKHGYGDADYWQGWRDADNEHGSEEVLPDWGPEWSASLTTTTASRISRLERQIETFLKQKGAHDDGMASQSVSCSSDRACRGGELNRDDAKYVVCEYAHGHCELISPNLIKGLKM